MSVNVYPSMHTIGWMDGPKQYHGYYVSTSSHSFHEEHHIRPKIVQFEAAVAKGGIPVDQVERIAGLIYVDQMSDAFTPLSDIVLEEVDNYTLERVWAEIKKIPDLFEGDMS